jgi:epoxyqueuosine reductase
MSASQAILDADAQSWLTTTAREAGFDLAGLASVPEQGSPETQADDQRFAAWVNAGHAGDMHGWLARTDAAGEFLRGNLRRHLPWARSVLVCAVNYNADAPRSIDPAPPGTGWIARYAWSGKAGSGDGSDYHDVLLEKLRRVEAAVQARFPGIETRAYVDTGPVAERTFATRAGIGWIAKNTCVINQQLGSWLLLGCLVTSLELAEQAMLPAADRCGTCTRCIDACPTQCIHEPTPEDPTRRLDATRCIAYLTIEHKGSIPEPLRPAIGRQVFGCDICQDVCPWNRKAPISTGDPMSAQRELINPELEWLASFTSQEFNQRFRNSPLERLRRKRLQRNVAIAMGNSGDPRHRPTVETLAQSPDEIVADAARWALGRLPID